MNSCHYAETIFWKKTSLLILAKNNNHILLFISYFEPNVRTCGLVEPRIGLLIFEGILPFEIPFS